ncbi:MAG TPA: histidine ammonia-lyase [Flavobacteriales bacterium]|jgi:histidine ammonia-lyase|nr:histidine ammonia-lyase [Flavobacteriales bacterium]
MTDSEFHIGEKAISPAEAFDVVKKRLTLKIAPDARQKIESCRGYLEKHLQESATSVYGINTGFGALYRKFISNEDLSKLQENLVKSHACGVGDIVDTETTRLIILLKINALSLGYSGIRLEVVSKMLELYNRDIIPVVYKQGSLGASGDLSPLAHLSLPLLGLGEVHYKEEIQPSKRALEAENIEPITLVEKEGLALLNGTQFMTAYAVSLSNRFSKLLRIANRIAAISLEAFDGRPEAFSARIQEVRNHDGQIEVAKEISSYLSGSEIARWPKTHVQDPYSFRCIPQVHGAVRDVLDHFNGLISKEINGVTDNPIIFEEEGEIISGGNFHGQPIAFGFDYLKLAMAELGAISERRTYKLVSGQRGLPEFLISDAGLNSGLMIPQYTAASLVSRNKQLASPASIDSIDSSNGQEDHVSMGGNAALQADEIYKNVEMILAIELLTASKAIEFRRPLKSSETLEEFLSRFREHVVIGDQDEVLYVHIHNAIAFIQSEVIA